MTFVPEDRILILLSADEYHDISMWNMLDETVPFYYREMPKLRILMNAILLQKTYKKELDVLEKQFSALKWYDDFEKGTVFPTSKTLNSDMKHCIEKNMIYQKKKNFTSDLNVYELTFNGKRQLDKMREIAGDYFNTIEKRIQKWGTICLNKFLYDVYFSLPEFQYQLPKEPEYGFPEKKRLHLPKIF